MKRAPGNDESFMRRALALARRGYGATSPNPMVGAVLVKGGKIIGQGWHRRAGEPHAEIEALRDAERRGHSPRGAVLYVGALLGIIVGTVIVAQTLYSSTKDHLKEFATLRAIGSSSVYIVKVILWQALLSAVIGFVIAAAIGLLIVRMTADTALPVVMTPGLTLGLLAITVVMCAISAISAILEVMRLDPAMVFAR